VRIELGGIAADPSATKEEHDRGTFVSRLMILRLEKMQRQLHVANRLVDNFLRWLRPLRGSRLAGYGKDTDEQ
jgi:hypothetical protein